MEQMLAIRAGRDDTRQFRPRAASTSNEQKGEGLRGMERGPAWVRATSGLAIAGEGNSPVTKTTKKPRRGERAGRRAGWVVGWISSQRLKRARPAFQVVVAVGSVGRRERREGR
jgi:hypothetical protein